ncbi:MAG: hypothetical protein WD651_02910 [Acidimicrobiia bacterium]
MTAASVPAIGSKRTGARSRAVTGFVLILVALIATWEGYKLLGSVTGGGNPIHEHGFAN